MKSADQPGSLTEETKVELDSILAEIRRQFYAGLPEQRFFQDSSMLQKAITWPATWLRGRGVAWTSERYFRVIREKLAEVKHHGATADVKFFPGYLMKVLQDHFAHNGDGYCREGKHVGNSIAVVLSKLSPQQAALEQKKETVTDVLAAAHALLASRPRASKTRKNAEPDQLSLL